MYGLTLEHPDSPGGGSHIRIVLDELYLENVYDFADVKGAVVFDIGAYCGETAIYFSKRGASVVYALEPFKSFDLISENSKLNNCNNILPIRGAISFSKSHVFINPEFVNDGGSRLQDGKGSTEINTYSLEDLINFSDMAGNKLKKYILKMDCEGGEFNAISSASKEVLRRFCFMMIETHDHSGNINDLVEYIKSCGFSVFSKQHFAGTSLLYARLII